MQMRFLITGSTPFLFSPVSLPPFLVGFLLSAVAAVMASVAVAVAVAEAVAIVYFFATHTSR